MSDDGTTTLVGALPFRLSSDLCEFRVVAPGDLLPAGVPAECLPNLAGAGRPPAADLLANRVAEVLLDEPVAVLPDGMHMLHDSLLNLSLRTSQPRCRVVCLTADGDRLRAAVQAALGGEGFLLLQPEDEDEGGVPPVALREAFGAALEGALACSWAPLARGLLWQGDFLRAPAARVGGGGRGSGSAAPEMMCSPTMAWDVTPEESGGHAPDVFRLVLRPGVHRIRAMTRPEDFIGSTGSGEGGLPPDLLE